MATARDWLKALRSASYKGVPFFVETDSESGGRRIVKHQFPMRDTPYLEDLGEDLREFEISAYLASDSVDSEGNALSEICATRGPGTLVLPMQGQVFVRNTSFERERSKDKHGYLAYKLKFTREGAAFALASIASLANLVFIAADSLATAAAASFAATVKIALQPDYVADAATNGFQDAVSALEVIRTSEQVAPAVSAVQRDEIQTLFTDASDLIATPALAIDAASRLIVTARALGAAIPAPQSARAYEAGLGDFLAFNGQSYPTAGALQAAQNGKLAARLSRMAAMAAYCEAIVGIVLTDRPQAITLRANVAEYIEAELEDLSASDIDLFNALEVQRDAVISYLSRAILDLAPIITVEANLRMPSLFWAWRLYKDPNRSPQLVARNRVRFPSQMPTNFEALSK